MSVFKRLAAAYMLLVAVAVAAHFLVTQFTIRCWKARRSPCGESSTPLMVIGVVSRSDCRLRQKARSGCRRG